MALEAKSEAKILLTIDNFKHAQTTKTGGGFFILF